MSKSDTDVLHRVQQYRKIVLVYEALDKEIDALIMRYGGGTEHMPPEALARYRELAHRRDDVQNDMRVFEQELEIGD